MSIIRNLDCEILEAYWDIFTGYIEDDIREKVHLELGLCRREVFLERYMRLVPDFKNNFPEFPLGLLDGEYCQLQDY